MFENHVYLLTDLKVSPEEPWFDLLGPPADGPEQCKCKNGKHTKHLYKKLYNYRITMLYSLTTRLTRHSVPYLDPSLEGTWAMPAV